ncbi:UNVERIFIED_CONTAM: hypothetical protein K2H54_027490 [Gekko kuhli]
MESPFASSYGAVERELALWREWAKPPQEPLLASSPVFISSADTYRAGREAPLAAIFPALHNPPPPLLNRQMCLGLALVAAAAAGEFYRHVEPFHDSSAAGSEVPFGPVPPAYLATAAVLQQHPVRMQPLPHILQQAIFVLQESVYVVVGFSS